MIEILHGTRETIIYDENILVRPYYNNEKEGYPVHWQPSYEVIMPLISGYTVFIEDVEINLNPDDILFIAPGMLHRIAEPEEGARYIMLFNPALFTSIAGLEELNTMFSPYALYNSETCGCRREMSHLIHNIYNEYAGSDPLKYAVMYSDILKLVIAAGRNRTDGFLMPDSSGSSISHKHLNRFLMICKYIETNCTENLTVTQLADQCGFSSSHFIRLFKQFTNVTYYAYLNQCRINKAKHLLAAEPALSITEISLLSGFSSIATFNRLFKHQVRCSPSEYRNLQSI